MEINALILAGGSGTRLWPLSRSSHPKQFLELDNNQTLIQSTVERLSDLNIKEITTICNDSHRFFVADQLNKISKLGKIIIEPESKNTAPAIAIAAFIAINSSDDIPMLVLSSDHNIVEKDKFTSSILNGLSSAESGKIVTFGIKPSKAHTGYGYIRTYVSKDSNIHDIDAFIEKPNEENAEKFFESENYFWNSGMFLFKPSIFLEELKKYNPEIYNACKKATDECLIESDFIKIDKKSFSSCPNDSIDYAVMENTKIGIMSPMEVTWSDIGSWSSLWNIKDKDKNNNVIKGDVLTHKTSNSLIYSEDLLVATSHIKDLVIVVSKDSILVSDKSKSEEVKNIVDNLKENKRSEWKTPREVHRPWGKYDSVDNGLGFQVKRITVKPGAKLSVQKHFHRSEHWVVVSGKAHVTINDKTFPVSVNESCYIPCEAIHALENKEKDILELVEVQLGDYLGEDDIVRFEDRYGRTED